MTEYKALSEKIALWEEEYRKKNGIPGPFDFVCKVCKKFKPEQEFIGDVVWPETRNKGRPTGTCVACAEKLQLYKLIPPPTDILCELCGEHFTGAKLSEIIYRRYSYKNTRWEGWCRSCSRKLR